MLATASRKCKLAADCSDKSDCGDTSDGGVSNVGVGGSKDGEDTPSLSCRTRLGVTKHLMLQRLPACRGVSSSLLDKSI